MESSLQAIKNKKGTLHFFFKPCNLLWVFQLSITCQHFSPAIYEIKQRNQWQESENEEHAAHADRKIGWHANHLATVVNAKK